MSTTLMRHVTTTRHTASLYPFQAADRLPIDGVRFGKNLLGGDWCWHPWDLYRLGILRDLNAVIFGHMGSGKTSLLLTIAARFLPLGYWFRVLDPKGEYFALAQAWDEAQEAVGAEGRASVIRLRPHGTTFLNPLDPRIPDADRQALVLSMIGALLGRALEPEESAACLVGLESLGRRGAQTLPALVDVMLRPVDGSGGTRGLSDDDLVRHGRKPALRLAEYVNGPMAGMFDRETSPGISLSSQLTVLDLKAVHQSPALGVLMLVADTWLQARPPTTAGFYVADEAWAVLSALSVASGLSASFKFCRMGQGTSHIIATHGINTLRAGGDDGSRVSKLGDVLLGDSSTRFIYRTNTVKETEAMREVLGFSAMVAEMLPYLATGRLFMQLIGSGIHNVEHNLEASEMRFIDPTGLR